jgi:hypothetical protein
MRVGYGRAPTVDQGPDVQRDALWERARQGPARGQGDQLVITELDRLGCSQERERGGHHGRVCQGGAHKFSLGDGGGLRRSRLGASAGQLGRPINR